MLRGNHRVALLKRRGHRFFTQDVTPGVQGVDADFGVDVGRRADVDDINIRFGGQHLLVAFIDARVIQAVARFFLVRFFRVDVHQRHDGAALAELQIALNMVMRDVPCSHDGDF
ncbi:hypothetical protein D3C81_1546670 [compost metagenome]